MKPREPPLTAVRESLRECFGDRAARQAERFIATLCRRDCGVFSLRGLSERTLRAIANATEPLPAALEVKLALAAELLANLDELQDAAELEALRAAHVHRRQRPRRGEYHP